MTVDQMPCLVVALTSTTLSCRIDASAYGGVYHAAVKVLYSVFLKQFLDPEGRSQNATVVVLLLVVGISSLASRNP